MERTPVSYTHLEKNLWIVSKCDASEAYTLLDEQINYFRLIIIVILIAESAAMYLSLINI